MKKDILGIGFFDNNNYLEGGQRIRTKQVFDGLSEFFSNNVDSFSYENWRKKPFKTFFNLKKKLKNTKRVLIFPASNAVKILLPLLIFMKKLYKFDLYYVAIGGSIIDITRKKRYVKYLNRIDGTFVQTMTMVRDLEQKYVNNVYLLPNFKHYNKIYNNVNYDFLENSFVFFSRVMEEKGIVMLLDVLSDLSTKGYNFHLDIYGPIEESFFNEFKKLIDNNSHIATYKGMVEPSDASSILRKYYMQIFPTMYFTEGFPGSVLDSLVAGLPVLASNWESAKDILNNNETAIIYDFNDKNDLKRKLEYVLNNVTTINTMREKCILESKKYIPHKIIKDMHEIIIRKESNIIY